MHGENGLHEILLQVIDDLAMAMFIISSDLRVTQMNAAAQDLVAGANGLRVEGARLRTSNGRQQEELEAILHAMTAAAPPTPACAYAMAIDRRGGPPLHVCVRPLIAQGRRMAAVYVIDPNQHPTLDDQLLRRAYSLSRAEIRVANELLQGHSVESVAELLGVSVHTVRTQLKNVFAKTGTCRQSELVRLMSSCLGGLRVGRASEVRQQTASAGSSDIFPAHDQ